MDRERIEQLLKMAREIEQLESQAAMRLDPVASTPSSEAPWSDAQAPLSFVQARKDQVKAMKAARREQAAAGRWRRVVSAAAVLLLGGFALQTFLPLLRTPVLTQGPIASKTDVKAPLNDGAAALPLQVASLIAVSEAPVAADPCTVPSPSFGSRIIAMVLDAENNCHCSQTVLHEWDSSRSVTEMTRADLLRIGFESSCISEPERILVVAVSGPVEDLPESDEDIAALANCVDLGSTTSGTMRSSMPRRPCRALPMASR
ncbi:MAG: hypothetical protein NTV94_02005 [Planctomycetota bacterium]|nr:hypothetical protein [Planctomycetota bacterium]